MIKTAMQICNTVLLCFTDFGQPLTRMDIYVEGPVPGIDFLVDTMSVIRAQILNNPDYEDGLSSWFCGGCTGSISTDSYSGNNAFLSASR